jgi:hypothetical protein
MLKRWLVCLLAFALCAGLVAAADAEKKEEKKEAKKEEKKDEKKAVVLPDAIAKALAAKCKEATIEEAKEKKEADKVCSYEVKIKCKCGQECKMVFAIDGKLLEASKCVIPADALPAAVADAVKKWAPGATVGKVEVETKKEKGTTYKVEAKLGEESVKAEIAEDGKVIKADKLPEPKVEKKKEEKKEAKKEEKKEEKKDK